MRSLAASGDKRRVLPLERAPGITPSSIFLPRRLATKMILRQCPITGGQPTRVRRTTFRRLCHQHKFYAQQHLGKRLSNYLDTSANTYCVEECLGPPPELSFMEEIMPKKVAKPGPSPQPLHGDPTTGEVAEALAILCADRDVENLPQAAQSRMQEIDDLRTKIAALSHDLADANALIQWQQEETSEPGSMRECIEQVCAEMRNFLIAKNGSYGNSVGDPVRIFSTAGPLEQINIRIDDKISRMMRGHGMPTDNDEIDLTGYLLLKQAVSRWIAQDVPC